MQVLLLAVCLAAPVPKEAFKPQGLTHGVYELMWSGRPYQATLNGNGEFSEFLPNTPQLWVGSWSWEPETRTLAVNETYNGGESWCRWSVVLDKGLNGKTNCGISVGLKRR